MIVKKIINNLDKYFQDSKMVYHTYTHSIEVYNNATQIAEIEEVNSEDLEVLQIAALFHDAGYSIDPSAHENVGAKIAEDYLIFENYPKEKIELVKSIVLATKMDYVPTTTLESIIKDADLGHIGKPTFKMNSELLKLEREYLNDDTPISNEDWLDTNIEFLQNHNWWSKGGKKAFNGIKKKNLNTLKEKQKKNEKDRPEKGVETMYRVALRNHNQLSKIADNKANIMLSITSIMLSLILSSLATKIDSHPRLLIPTLMIITTNLVTMIFSILATRPKVSSSEYSREGFLKNKINILFFGNFYKIPLDEFEWGMRQLMKDKDLLYGSLSKDLYFLGIVLAKKYKFLQYAYSIFMGGLIISVFAFVLALI